MTMQMHILIIFLLFVVVLVGHHPLDRLPDQEPRLCGVHLGDEEQGLPVEHPEDSGGLVEEVSARL